MGHPFERGKTMTDMGAAKEDKWGVRPYPETHIQGFLMLENMDIHQIPAECDLGVQVAEDGRIWLCVNGIAFIRFTPWGNRKMQRDDAPVNTVETGDR